MVEIRLVGSEFNELRVAGYVVEKMKTD
jgi:hypothetical protein